MGLSESDIDACQPRTIDIHSITSSASTLTDAWKWPGFTSSWAVDNLSPTVQPGSVHAARNSLWLVSGHSRARVAVAARAWPTLGCGSAMASTIIVSKIMARAPRRAWPPARGALAPPRIRSYFAWASGREDFAWASGREETNGNRLDRGHHHRR